jgi:hypothetical protein
MQILIIMIWSKASRVRFWPGSHRHWLFPVEAANSLLAVSRLHLRRLGLESKEEVLDNGGFTIHDARVAFQVQAGSAIVFAIGGEAAVEGWEPMELPMRLKYKVSEMENANFMVNVRYTPDSEALGSHQRQMLGRRRQ